MPRRDASLDSILAGSQSKSFRALNAHYYPAVGGLPCAVPQPDALREREGENRGAQEGAARMAKCRGRRRNAPAGGPCLRVHLVAFRRVGRELDGVDHYMVVCCAHSEPLAPKQATPRDGFADFVARWNAEAVRLFMVKTAHWTAAQRAHWWHVLDYPGEPPAPIPPPTPAVAAA